jgi:hypothetical protein
MATISYDKPISDFIDELSATGHVTHTPYKKTSVTLHHNGGVNVSHQEILNTWKTRPASAHFDVDTNGNVAQYVKVDEYAWAVGDNYGNQSTISIEQADSTGAPGWVVSETTWKASARLAAWLFIHVIQEPPSSDNVFPHQHWSSTDCPGPWVLTNWITILNEIKYQYNILRGLTPGPVPSPPSPASNSLLVDGQLGTKTIWRWQQIMHTPVDGVISITSNLVAAVQRELNSKISAGLVVDGQGIRQDGHPYKTVHALQKYLGTTQDSVMSLPVSEVVKELQRRLNKGSF